VAFDAGAAEPGDAIYCPSFTTAVDPRGNDPFLGQGQHATNMNNGVRWIRSYRVNDWFAAIPAGHGWNPVGPAKPLPRTADIRNTSRLILFGEGHSKNGYMRFNELYLNPEHGDLSPQVRADGSVQMYEWINEDRTGVWWNPNFKVTNTFEAETWGPYLDPRYSKEY